MAIPVPITARIHYDDERKLYRLAARREDPRSADPFSSNENIEIIEKFLTLLELLAVLADFFSGVGPTGTTGPISTPIGSWADFAKWAALRAGGSFTP